MKKLIVGMIISVLGLYLAFRKVDIHSLGNVLGQAHLGWILAAVFLLLGSVWVRALRYRIIVLPIKQIRKYPLFANIMIGNFGNNVLPFRLGEILRAYALKMDEEVSASSAFGTVVVERVVDMVGFLVFLIIIFFWGDIPQTFSIPGIIIGISVILVGIILWWISKTHQEWIIKFEKLSIFQKKYGQKAIEIIDKFVQGLIVLRKTKHVSQILVITLLLWFIYLMVTFASLKAVHISANGMQAGVLLIATSLAISIPSAPGFIGTWHVAAVFVLVNIYQQSTDVAQAYAILNHAINFIPLTLVGLYYFIKSSVKFREIKKLKIENNSKNLADE